MLVNTYAYKIVFKWYFNHITDPEKFFLWLRVLKCYMPIYEKNNEF